MGVALLPSSLFPFLSPPLPSPSLLLYLVVFRELLLTRCMLHTCNSRCHLFCRSSWWVEETKCVRRQAFENSYKATCQYMRNHTVEIKCFSTKWHPLGSLFPFSPLVRRCHSSGRMAFWRRFELEHERCSKLSGRRATKRALYLAS